MKQNLFNKLWLRVGMIVAIMTTALSGTAWADDILNETFNISGTDAVSSTYNGWSVTRCWGGNGSIRLGASSGDKGQLITPALSSLSGNATLTFEVKRYSTDTGSIGITVSDGNGSVSGDVSVASSSISADSWTSKTVSITGGSSTTKIKFLMSNKRMYLRNVRIVAESGSTPSISADNVEILYSATGGSISYSVENSVEGGTVSAAVTSGNWLTLGNETTSPISFTCSANTSSAARTATVQLTYTYNTNETVTKNVTVTQAGDPNGPGTENNPYTVAQAIANTPSTGNVYIQGIVSDFYNTSIVGDGNNYRYYISDDGGTTTQLLVFKGKGLNEATFTNADDLLVGDEVIIYGSLITYQNAPEVASGNYLYSWNRPAAAIEAPTFSPAAGTYASAQNVTLSCETTGATIYYTTDGSTPTSASTQYTGAISVSTTTTIKAIAIKGSDESTVTTATYHFCSAENPYTVTQALAFNEYPANGIYVTGIVSTAPTQAPTNNGELTYYISDDGTTGTQLEVYKGKDLNNESFTAQDDIQVGDIVTIYGNVKDYQGTIEFDKDNYLVAFERPAVPVINAESTLTLAYDATSGEITYTIDNPTDATLTAALTTGDWISNVTVDATNNKVTFDATENEGNADRTATITLSYSGAESVTVTVTQKHYVEVYSGGTFTKFTGNIEDGYYVITYTAGSGTSYVMKNTISSNRFTNGTFPTIINDVITDPTGDLKDIVWHIEANGNYWTLYNDDVEKYAAGTNTKNQGALIDDVTDLAKWTVTVDNNGKYEFENLGRSNASSDSGNKFLRNNTTSGWACYGTGTGGSLTLYKLGQASTEPSITVASNSVDVTAESGDNGTIGITYANLTINDMNDFGVQFYDEQGDEIASGNEPSWIEVLVAEQDPQVGEGYVVSYSTLEDNDGAARTAYFKVFADGGTDFVYSNLVTITQAAYVAPATGYQYALFTGALVEGDYIIYYDGNAMNTTVTSDRLQYEEVTPVNDVITTDDATIVWHIAPSGNYWTIYNADANAYAASTGAKNKAQMLADGTDDKALWTVSGTATYEFVNKQNTTNDVNANLRKNGTYGFACYAEGTGGALTLYKKVVESVTVGNLSYATFASDNALDFTGTGIQAFYATVSGTTLTFTEITKVPANTGVLLYADGGATEDVPVLTGAADDVSGNVFARGEGTAVTYTDNDQNYILFNGEDGIGFYKANNNTVATNRAYIHVTSGNPVKSFAINLEEDATGISLMEDGRSQMEDGAIYNLAGQRLDNSQLKRGIYIVNGKKILK